MLVAGPAGVLWELYVESERRLSNLPFECFRALMASTTGVGSPLSGTSAASVFRSAGGEVPPGMDVDHMIDLQLGGADTLTNMSPLDLSVNRSLGAQIAAQIRRVPVGTCVIAVRIC